MPTLGRLHDKAPAIVYLIGALLVVLIAAAAIWMVAGNYRAAVANAKQHLDNFAVVVAEQTGFALRNAPADVLLALNKRASGSALTDPEEMVQRYLSGLYGGLELPYNGRVMLFRTDGTLLSVFPRRSGLVGRGYASHALFAIALPRAPEGTLETIGILDGGDRLLAYRAVKDYPVVLGVSAPTSEILSSWRRDALIVGTGTLLLMVLAALATVFLGRQLKPHGQSCA